MNAIISQRSQWLGMLAKLTSPIDPQVAARAFAAYSQLLADLPDEVFTVASLEAVASKCRFVTTYGELRGHLAAWWRDNRPRCLPIADHLPDQRPPPSDAECVAVRATVARLVADLAAIAADVPHLDHARPNQPKPRHLTRSQLAEAYKAAAIPGPYPQEPQEAATGRPSSARYPTRPNRMDPYHALSQAKDDTHG